MLSSPHSFYYFLRGVISGRVGYCWPVERPCGAHSVVKLVQASAALRSSNTAVREGRLYCNQT